MSITFEEAKELLRGCTRDELRDHAFGDMEVSWTNSANEPVASGYSGGIGDEVGFEGKNTHFDGDEARELMKLGTLGDVSRNDSTGPDRYQQGVCSPGLTTEGVLDELVNTK